MKNLASIRQLDSASRALVQQRRLGHSRVARELPHMVCNCLLTAAAARSAAAIAALQKAFVRAGTAINMRFRTHLTIN